MTKHALIEKATNKLLDVSTVEFPVVSALMWVDCADTITAHGYTYDGTNFLVVPAPPGPTQWYLLKSTIRTRLTTAGLVDAADTARAALPAAQQNAWLEAVVIHNDDANLIALLTAIGANPSTILAADPDATKFFGVR